MNNELTRKQELFAQRYVETGNKSQAYRDSYNAENMKDVTIWNKACEISKKDKVRVRIEELKKNHVERHGITVDNIVKELAEDKEFARECNAPSTVLRSTELKAKLYGLFVDQMQVTGTIDIDMYKKEVEDNADDIINSL